MFRSFLICIAAFLAVTARADESALSLDEAVRLALDRAPQVAARASDLEGARSASIATGRMPDPELVLAVDNLPVDGDDRFSFTRDFMTMRRIGVMQTFPSGSKRRAQSERGVREIELASAELRSARFDTARAAADAWIARAEADESYARLATLAADVDLQATSARASLASGRASAAEALDAQSLAVTFKARLLELRQQSEMQRAELRRWIGEDADRPLAGIPTGLDLGHAPEALVASVSEHAPLAPMVAQVALAESEIALARADKRPDWSAELAFAKRGPDFSNMVSLEVRVGLPLFGGKRQDPLIADKLARLHAMQADRDAEIRMHTAEIESAAAAWHGGRERLQLYEKELLPLARDRSRAAIASYGAGRGALPVAIDALSREVDTQLDYVRLEAAVARSWALLHFLHDSGSTP